MNSRLSRVTLHKVNPRKESVQPQQQDSQTYDRLVELVRAWRSKYEKLLVETNGTKEIIESMKKEIETVKNEKEIVSKQLLETIASERDKYDQKIYELQTIADTAAMKAEIECRELKTKCHRLENEIKPIIDMYKDREAKMQELVARTLEENEDLRNLVNQLEDEMSENKKQHLDEINDLLAEKSAEMRNMKSKLVNVKISFAKRMKGIKEEQERSTQEETSGRKKERSGERVESEITEEIHKEWEEKEIRYKNEIKRISLRMASTAAATHQKIQTLENEKRHLVSELKAKIRENKKKTELSRLQLKRKVQEIKDLKSLMGDINIQLSTNRTKNKKTTKTSLSVKDLLHRLVVTMEELKNIEKSLDRIHSMEKQDYSIDVDYALRLEILYRTQVSDFIFIRKQIHDSIFRSTYKPLTRNKTPIVTSHTDDELVLLRSGYSCQSESIEDLNNQNKKLPNLNDSHRISWMTENHSSVVEL